MSESNTRHILQNSDFPQFFLVSTDIDYIAKLIAITEIKYL
jgi:hypothetical protein